MLHERFIRGVDNAQLLSHTLWFRTERQAEEKEGRETDSEHKDKEMMITLLWLYEHTSWSQEFSHHGYLVLNASESNIIMFCLFYCVCRLFDRVIWTITVYAERSRRCHTHSLACLSSSMHHHYQLLLLLFLIAGMGVNTMRNYKKPKFTCRCSFHGNAASFKGMNCCLGACRSSRISSKRGPALPNIPFFSSSSSSNHFPPKPGPSLELADMLTVIARRECVRKRERLCEIAEETERCVA